MKVKLENTEGYNTLEVKAYYSKGGVNMFSYKNERRGLYVNFRALMVKEENGYAIQSFMMFQEGDASFKFLALPMTRDNKKKVASYQDKLNAMDPERVALLFEAGDQRRLAEMALEAMGLEWPEAA